MYSATEDLWKFTQAVMKSELLSVQKTKAIFNDNSGRYGYGWGIRSNKKQRFYGHHGGMNGFVGSVSYIPDGKYFICFLKNDENAPWYTLAKDLVSIVLGESVETPLKEKHVPLSKSVIANTIGHYLIKAGDTLSIYKNKGRLFMKETGQRSHQLFQVEGNQFVCAQLEFKVQFSSLSTKAEWLEFNGAVKLKAIRVNEE